MKKRNIAAIFILTFITFGLYALYLMVKTKTEMNKLGAQIPTAVLIIVPFVNIYWIWKYSEGVEFVTKGRIISPLSFLLLMSLNLIGFAVIQNEFNNQVLPQEAILPTASVSDNQIVGSIDNSSFNTQPTVASVDEPMDDVSMQSSGFSESASEQTLDQSAVSDIDFPPQPMTVSSDESSQE